MAFTFRQLFSPDTPGGGGASERTPRNIDKESEERAEILVDNVAEILRKKKFETPKGKEILAREERMREKRYKVHSSSQSPERNNVRPQIEDMRAFSQYEDVIAPDIELMSNKTEVKGKLDGIIKPTMPEKKEPTSQDLEDKALSAEDLQLKNSLYESSKKCRDILREQIAKNPNNEKYVRDLEEFEQSPYFWMKMNLQQKIENGEVALEGAKEELEALKIKAEIIKNKQSLNTLSQAMVKDLPLKLDREFTAKEMSLDDGTRFKVEQSIDDINKRIGRTDKTYEIHSVVQRQYGDFIILKNEKGEGVELDMSIAEEISSPEYKKKLEDFENIKKGETLIIRVGEKDSDDRRKYEVTKKSKNSITFKNLDTGEQVVMSASEMKEFFFNRNTHFFLKEEDKIPSGSFRAVKAEDLVAKIPPSNDATQKIPPLVSPGQPTPTVIETPEKTGPTAEQLAKLEILAKMGRELDPKIKELEEEIQRDLKEAENS